jgi:hypothetical protein
MVLIKNVAITSKGDQYLKAQQHTIFKKAVDEATRARLLKLHNKLSTTRPTLKERNFFLLIFFKNSMVANVHLNVIYTLK